jgi:hypothetical protein
MIGSRRQYLSAEVGITWISLVKVLVVSGGGSFLAPASAPGALTNAPYRETGSRDRPLRGAPPSSISGLASTFTSSFMETIDFGLQYGLQNMEPGGIPAFTLPSTFYLQI